MKKIILTLSICFLVSCAGTASDSQKQEVTETPTSQQAFSNQQPAPQQSSSTLSSQAMVVSQGQAYVPCLMTVVGEPMSLAEKAGQSELIFFGSLQNKTSTSNYQELTFQVEDVLKGERLLASKYQQSGKQIVVKETTSNCASILTPHQEFVVFLAPAPDKPQCSVFTDGKRGVIAIADKEVDYYQILRQDIVRAMAKSR